PAFVPSLLLGGAGGHQNCHNVLMPAEPAREPLSAPSRIPSNLTPRTKEPSLTGAIATLARVSHGSLSFPPRQGPPSVPHSFWEARVDNEFDKMAIATLVLSGAALRRTCHRSRRPAQPTASTAAPTFTASA